jgi:HEPN domain-containing protein
MKPSTQEWIDKAEGDFIAALTLYRARKHKNYDTACYHTQQSVEKYLKARLEEAGQPIPRTHNLYALLKLVQPIEPGWSVMATDLNVLGSFAIVYRYPGATATKVDAADAIKRCRRISRRIRTSFGLPV